jgi:hypothetical protein
MLLDFEKFVKHKSKCERGFQKKKRPFLPGIELASSVVDDSNPLSPDATGLTGPWSGGRGFENQNQVA